MKYTLGQAAKATGMNKMTISRAIGAGRISAVKNEKGEYSIDPAELYRVYPPAGVTDVTENGTLLHRVKELEIRLEAEQERVADQKQMIQEIQQERDDWKKQAQTLLLIYRPETPQKPLQAVSAPGDTFPPPNPQKRTGGQIFGLSVAVLGVLLALGLLFAQMTGVIHVTVQNPDNTDRRIVNPVENHMTPGREASESGQ